MTRHWPALLVAATLTVSAFPRSLSAQTPRFAAHKDFPSGHRPASVAVGDLNGDLVQDLALANSGDDSAAVLLGNGDGTFQPPRSVYFAAGASPQSIAIADFNKNGRPDLVVANTGKNAVAVLPGNGDGTFQAPVDIGGRRQPQLRDRRRFQRRYQAGPGDREQGSNTVSVRLGNGNGTFQTARNFAVAGGPFFVTIGDFNRDSKSDLVVANSGSGRLAVLRGNGDGTFQAPVLYAPGEHAQRLVGSRGRLQRRWEAGSGRGQHQREQSFSTCSATAMGRSRTPSASLPGPVRPPWPRATSTTTASWM